MATVSNRAEQFLEMFRDRVGEPTRSANVPQIAFDKYQGKLPNVLLDYWRMDGWSAYQDGLWWLVNPAEHDATVAEWLAGTPFERTDRYHLIARTAFGTLCLWGEKLSRRVLVDCCGGYIVAQAKEFNLREEDPELAMSILLSNLDREKGDIEDEEGNSLFDAAFSKFGMLSENQVYGFEPALVLGGKLSVENIRVLQLDIHLSILRQFGAPRVPGF